MKKDLRPATLLKRRLWHGCFPVNFVKFLRTPFLRTYLDDCFRALWRLATGNCHHNASKTFATGKSTVVSIIAYRNILSDFREPQVEQPKQLLHLKKPLTANSSGCRCNSDSWNWFLIISCFSNHSLKKEAGTKSVCISDSTCDNITICHFSQSLSFNYFYF